MSSKYAFQIEKLKTMYETPWALAAPAFRVFGNLYFVGNRDGASWLLDASGGPILFDTNYPTADALLIHSIWSLGFDPCKIQAIFHTHGHFDHFGATALIKGLSGATTYLSAADAAMLTERPELSCIPDSRNAYLTPLIPDIEVRDGDTFSFGGVTVSAKACPGHTPGAMSWFFPVTDGEHTYRAGLHGGAGLNTLCRDYREQHQVDWREDFLRSIDRMLEEPVDIFLGNHTGQNDALRKYERMKAGEGNPFLDPAAWPIFLESLREKYNQMIRDEEAGTDQI
ncbi:MAG: MBL fold metallo-hydrolase [Clostridia bacterium]|nr:MBL fold metallo-hydrolase [Clostridia bacterium]